jgi:fructose-bisphosphate aldolase, class II
MHIQVVFYRLLESHHKNIIDKKPYISVDIFPKIWLSSSSRTGYTVELVVSFISSQGISFLDIRTERGRKSRVVYESQTETRPELFYGQDVGGFCQRMGVPFSFLEKRYGGSTMLMNMRDLLAVAHKHNFAVPAFNVSSNMLLKGAIEASEEKRAPVIVAIHPDELSFIRPSFVKTVIEEAINAMVPVCIHLDHGSSMGQIVEAIRCGFTSVMIDASAYPLEQNIEVSKRVVDLAHSVNVSVEGELGTIGTTGPEAEAGSEEIIYVNPDDVVTFVEATCVDTLAVAIGTLHGIYPKDKKPELRIDLLKEITSRVNIPLVLHGGSANPEAEIAAAVKLGVNKINISSDIKDAFYQKCREVLANPFIREPFAIYPPCIEAMKQVCYQKFALFDAEGKAELYYRVPHAY